MNFSEFGTNFGVDGGVDLTLSLLGVKAIVRATDDLEIVVLETEGTGVPSNDDFTGCAGFSE